MLALIITIFINAGVGRIFVAVHNLTGRKSDYTICGLEKNQVGTMAFFDPFSLGILPQYVFRINRSG